MKRSLCCIALLGLSAWSLPGTTVDPLTWEQLVDGADFVGVVRCTQAGGIVAKYVVEDSWKGPPAGTEFALRVPPDAWGSQFPIALCDEQYVITAYKSAPSTMMSTTGHGTVPLWWRNVPSDYTLPLFQGRYRVSPEGGEPLYFEELSGKSVGQLKQTVRDFVSLAEADREERLLRSQVAKYLKLRHYGAKDRPDPYVALRGEVDSARGVEQIVKQLLRGRAKLKEDDAWGVDAALRGGGGRTTLQVLESVFLEESKLTEDLRNVVEEIRSRVPAAAIAPTANATASLPKRKPLAASAVRKLRKQLTTGPLLEDLTRIVHDLTPQDPEAVADYLVKWKNTETEWWAYNAGYQLGSIYAAKCERDRVRNFTRLLAARDDLVRVAAGVYLCFEDQGAGMAALRKFTALPGEAGSWAALNLGRRGDKGAIPRALEVLRTYGRPNMEGTFHRILQNRLQVLLSNSAKASRLPQPDAPPRKQDEKEEEHLARLYRSYHAWWQRHGDAVTLHDPWLPILSEQKLD